MPNKTSLHVMKSGPSHLIAWTTVTIIGTAIAWLPSVHAQSVIQLGLIIDASSSTEDELPTFRKGVADALATLQTDGSLELTLVQFSAEGKVIFGPAKIDSEAVRQEAVDTALTLDPTFTDIPPFEGGTNIEDALLETFLALQGAPNAADASLQFVNMLTDGHPTSHNHLGFSDFDETARHQRGQTFAKAQRDALVAGGVDVISFEALGSSDSDINYLKTLAYPDPPAVLDSVPLVFPSPITDQGFLLPIATVSGIADALSAKFQAAGFAVSLEPKPLRFDVEAIQLSPNGTIEITWTGREGFRYQVEYSEDLDAWLQDLPDSLLAPVSPQERLTFSSADTEPTHRHYRVVEFAN